MVMGYHHGGVLSKSAFTPYGLKIRKQVFTKSHFNALRSLIRLVLNTISRKRELYWKEVKLKILLKVIAIYFIKYINVNLNSKIIEFKITETNTNRTTKVLNASFKCDKTTIKQLVNAHTSEKFHPNLHNNKVESTLKPTIKEFSQLIGWSIQRPLRVQKRWLRSRAILLVIRTPYGRLVLEAFCIMGIKPSIF